MVCHRTALRIHERSTLGRRRPRNSTHSNTVRRKNSIYPSSLNFKGRRSAVKNGYTVRRHLGD